MSGPSRNGISSAKQCVRAMLGGFVRLFPRATGRIGLELLTIAAAQGKLPAAAIARSQRVLDETDAAGYRQECYAQEGEDIIVARLLDEQKHGFYVDVGAHHPIRHSNTYRLYRQGWSGLNIDATPGSMEPFRRLRPRDINIECLVSSKPSSHVFHMFNEPALNTASLELADLRPRESADYKVIQSVTLQSRTLASLLQEHLPAGGSIDLMSIDVEGLDLDVLTSNDWDRYRPRLLLVELLATEIDNLASHPTVTFLAGKGYHPVAKLYNTAILRYAPHPETPSPI
jgi:FkbM family methyltransferase